MSYTAILAFCASVHLQNVVQLCVGVSFVGMIYNVKARQRVAGRFLCMLCSFSACYVVLHWRDVLYRGTKVRVTTLCFMK